uniref:cAMP-dependent protein kinase inhibitor beta n=1 Tax=Scophthalmus maximus TaxID=52904 RepID=A0A8D3BFA3_SCOMX
MTEVEPVLDFATSGRSGRRNALPDILGSPAGVNPGDLPLKLAELSVEGNRDYLSFSLSGLATTEDSCDARSPNVLMSEEQLTIVLMHRE